MAICNSCFWAGVAGGESVGRGELGVRRAVVGRDVQGRRGRGLDAQGSEAEQHTFNVARVRPGQGALGAVVIEGEAQELGRDWASLDLVETGQGRNKIVEVEVVAILVFDTKIVGD
jgi:hypothetical protein